MKAIVAGGRDFIPNDHHKEWLIFQLERNEITTVLCGMAKGADTFGEETARELVLNVEYFPANWLDQGKAAGPLRNEEMAKNADICILFPGGSGTRDMKRRAEAHGLKIIEWRGIES
jgi:hypothetical protein